MAGMGDVGRKPDDPWVAVLVASVIAERPICLACLADDVNASQLVVRNALERLAKTQSLTVSTHERCQVCRKSLRPVYSLARSNRNDATA